MKTEQTCLLSTDVAMAFERTDRMMAHDEREYGQGGWIGLGTPQANPTMEAEFRRLLPPDTELLVSRLQGSNGSSE